MHWQVKLRGPEFAPLVFELERFETDSIKDAKGRLMPTILAKPMLVARVSQLARDNLTAENRLLISLRDNPALSLEQRGTDCGGLHKEKVRRIFQKMGDQKLVRKFRTNWELTNDRKRALEGLERGPGFAPEIDPGRVGPNAVTNALRVTV